MHAKYCPISCCISLYIAMKKIYPLELGHIQSPCPKDAPYQYSNAFRPVVNEKIFWIFIKIIISLPLIGTQKATAPLFEHILITIL